MDEAQYAGALEHAKQTQEWDWMGEIERAIERITRDVAELPDRTSPEDWHKALSEVRLAGFRACREAAAEVADKAFADPAWNNLMRMAAGDIAAINRAIPDPEDKPPG